VIDRRPVKPPETGGKIAISSPSDTIVASALLAGSIGKGSFAELNTSDLIGKAVMAKHDSKLAF
jgi:hypothetical protein